MPTPKKGEKRNDYVSRCIEQRMREDKMKPMTDRKPQKQHIAICESMYDEMMKQVQMMPEDKKS